ncbi:hypothetical protein [Croceicoccus sp. BE223]|uniref:hypothetical protein n=1 Tax=Croceicoccus sp. BE223 TaxID=2817716 RepID=UPI00285F553C|nr:hypothetical protein [Croceicoccus sp. BE223]MDR7101437.1 hypothetical protein [Croceicoccus sp. BE223]
MERRIEPADSLDYFPTQPWATRAICEFLIRDLGQDLSWQTAWEPACGEMFMADPLAEYFGTVIASDVHRYSNRHGLHDFLLPGATYARPDWIITNPPFRLADKFIARARQIARAGVVMFVRSSFAEGGARYGELFGPDCRPSWVVTYSERVVLLKGRLIRSGSPDPFNLDAAGQPMKASSATSYSLMIWTPGDHDTRHRWIAPCRAQLERDADFPAYAEQWARIRPPVDPPAQLALIA